jgi:hypothetical protein
MTVSGRAIPVCRRTILSIEQDQFMIGPKGIGSSSTTFLLEPIEVYSGSDRFSIGSDGFWIELDGFWIGSSQLWIGSIMVVRGPHVAMRQRRVVVTRPTMTRMRPIMKLSGRRMT